MIKQKLLKQIFIIIILFFSLNSYGFCADYTSSKLNEIEQNYYGYTYSDNVESRLARIETSLYSQPSKGNIQKRLNRLYKDLNIVNAQDQNTQTAMKDESKPDIGPKADAGIKYPIVDTMEQKIFKKAYLNDDIYVRLSRLEKQVFKKESTRSLNERTDALRDKILGGTKTAAADIDPSSEEIILENGEKYNDDNSANEDGDYNYYSYENSKNRIPEVQSKFEDNDTTAEYAPKYQQNYDLDILEKQLYGKRFSTESPQQRLARLENSVFQRTFNDGSDARTQRRLAVTTAKKTSQAYDSNKWAQRINTGIQIGSILLMVLAMIL